MPNDTLWTGAALDDLRDEFGDVYDGRTVLVTGADGFMGSHLTDALVELGASVHAFVRATSSGALNNIGHLRNRLKIHFADLTDRTSVDYLVRELKETAPDRPYVFHLGAQAHVGESWHRPYETVMANIARHAQPAAVGRRLRARAREVRHGRHLGGVRQRPRGRRPTTTTSTTDGGLILHERSPINPKSIYATAKVAADFLTMNYHDAFGGPGRRHADVQQLRPAPEPALRDRDDHHAGARRASTIELGAPRAAARLLLLHRRRPRPSHGRRTRHARRRLRLRPGREHLHARLGRPDPPRRRGARASGRATARSSRRRRATGRARARSWPSASVTRSSRARRAGSRRCRGRRACSQTIRWYAENRDRWIGRVDWLPTGAPLTTKPVSRVLVTGGGGFLGSHLVERLEAAGHDVVAARSADYDLTSMDDTARLFDDAEPDSCSTSRPRSAASAPTARTPGGTGTRT